MPKGYRAYLPEQDLLLPPSLRQWLPESHLVYFVSDVVDQLDLSAIHAVYQQEQRGQPPYDPRLMTKLLVYGYCTGVFSSRRIQKRLQEDIPFKVLAAGNQPDFRTISEFRKIHIETLENLFEQVLAMALECGSIKLGRVSLDGTKLKANASKHKAMSYRRMQEEEKRLKEEARRLLAEAEQADKEEDRRYGRSGRGEELPAELARREERLKRIVAAKRDLEQRAQADKRDDKDTPSGSSRSSGRGADVKPKATAQHNFTDPESRIMKGPDGFVQAYNAQIAVEPALGLIVAQALTQEANDKNQLLPMIDAVKRQSGQKAREVLADSGYCSEKNLCEAAHKKIDLYVATGKQKHNQASAPSPRGPIPKSATAVDRMKRKLTTATGRAIYATRKTIVEPVFGHIKQGRGFRQFLLRGVDKVRGEWALVCATHNVLKLYRACTS